jgi:hypothetical protein
MDLAMSALPSEANIRAGLQDVCFVAITGHFYSQSRPFESNEQAPMHNAPTIENGIRYSKGKTLPIKARITQIAIAAPTTAIKGALKTTGIKCERY